MNPEGNEAKPGLRVVIVGSINVDYLTKVDRHPGPGETVTGQETHTLPGGKGANQAVAAARLGADTALIGSIGHDANAAIAVAKLEEARVDVSGLVAVEAPTGTAFVTVDGRGENTIVVIAGANSCTDAAAVLEHRDAITEAGILVVQGEIPASGTEAAISLATGRVILNLAPVITLSPESIQAADPLVVNEHEAALVLHQLDPALPVPTDHAELAAALGAAGPRSVVLTRGSLGALFTDGSSIRAVSAPKVEAVDTTGAGDAFVGALSAGLARGATLGEAVELASRAGAYSVQRPGTQASYPTAADALPEVGP